MKFVDSPCRPFRNMGFAQPELDEMPLYAENL